jgi:hypothetical protein
MADGVHPPRREYSPADVLEHIRRLADGEDPPTRREFDGDGAAPSSCIAQRRFGSWTEAVEAAGFEARQRGRCRRWSDAEIIKEIQRLADGEDPPTMQEFDADGAAPSAVTARNRFGSWNEAVEAAGFEPRPGSKRYTRGELLDWLVAYRVEFGTWPSGDDFAEWPGPCKATFRKEFGGLVAAREAAAEVLDDA